MERQIAKKKFRMTIFLKCCPERQFANKLSGISICKKSAWNTNFQNLEKKLSTTTISEKSLVKKINMKFVLFTDMEFVKKFTHPDF